jgi:hypothetical protein
MNRTPEYYLLSASGSCSMFVASLMAQYLGAGNTAVISERGDCHDHGNGFWQETDIIEVIGDYWKPNKYYQRPLLYSHYTDLADVRCKFPDIKIVLVDFEPNDVRQISYFRTLKAHHLTWSRKEYDIFAGPDWPEYSPNNIIDSQIVRNELTEHQIPHTQHWLTQVDRNLVDNVLQFKTILSGNINQAVADIMKKPVRSDLESFVKEYQTVNERLRV